MEEQQIEANLRTDAHLLICCETQLNDILQKELDFLKTNFCGTVGHIEDVTESTTFKGDGYIYFCGNALEFIETTKLDTTKLLIVQELSYNYDDSTNQISMGELPMNTHNMGVLFRNYFGQSQDYFDRLVKTHDFQLLTESNKPGSSYRKGIYLSKVDKDDDVIDFNLLRCSTNLQGPTDNFRDLDEQILNKINKTAQLCFSNPGTFNHVLAQIYGNSTVQCDEGVTKDKKARIKSHSDKTDDMPANGLIAFCTFYSDNLRQLAKESKEDHFDHVYKHASVLTRLRFKLKKCVSDREHLQDEFSVLLYPNSCFIIPLSTNRLYTHEIAPPTLPSDKVPTRLGYVIRCSDTKAVFKDGKTYIRNQYGLEVLEKPTDANRAELKELYHQENMTDQVVKYGMIRYSVNDGDFLEPIR